MRNAHRKYIVNNNNPFESSLGTGIGAQINGVLYMYANLPRNVIAKLPHPRSRDS